MLPERATRCVDESERISGLTIDWSSLGAYQRLVRDSHDLILSALLQAITEDANRYPVNSWERCIFRAQHEIIREEMQARKRGDLPWFARPNVQRELSIKERCELVHYLWTMERFIQEELGIELKRNRCRCPVHDGDSAQSFSVRDNRGKCFVCGFSGDVIALSQEVFRLARPIDAVRRLEKG